MKEFFYQHCIYWKDIKLNCYTNDKNIISILRKYFFSYKLCKHKIESKIYFYSNKRVPSSFKKIPETNISAGGIDFRNFQNKRFNLSITPKFSVKGNFNAKALNLYFPIQEINPNIINFILTGFIRYIRTPQPFFIHAAGVCKENKGVLFIGPRGSGKSSLNLFLLEKGSNFISDDKLLIDADTNNGIFLYPFYMGIGIPQDVIENFYKKGKTEGHFGNAGIGELVSFKELYPNRESKIAKLNRIIFLKLTNKNTLLKGISPVESMKYIFNNTSFFITSESIAQAKFANFLFNVLEHNKQYILFVNKNLKENSIRIPELVSKLF